MGRDYQEEVNRSPVFNCRRFLANRSPVPVTGFEGTQVCGRAKVAVSMPQPLHNSNKSATLRRSRIRSIRSSKGDVQYRGISTSCSSKGIRHALSSLQPAKHSPGGLDSAEDTSPLSHHVRLVMRHVPHSVVVITSVLPLAKPNHAHNFSYRGMTVSSFTTVALSPRPTVCFNIRAPSSTLAAIQTSGRFLVHILDASPLGAKVADAFTRGLGATAFDNKAFEVSRDGDGMPLLTSPGVRRVLQCRALGDGVVVGDHVIIIGEVTKIRGEVQEEESEKGYGLVYANRAYRCVGKDIPVGGD
jgi:flavin reductase (DIM6/NTAB) family NADH-FMN oxidoreductase RutF